MHMEEISFGVEAGRRRPGADVSLIRYLGAGRKARADIIPLFANFREQQKRSSA
jgi:hypothetical protein